MYKRQGVERRKGLTLLRRLFIQRRAEIISGLPIAFEAVTKSEDPDEITSAAEAIEESADDLVSLMMIKKKLLENEDVNSVPDLVLFEDRPTQKRKRSKPGDNDKPEKSEKAEKPEKPKKDKKKKSGTKKKSSSKKKSSKKKK